MTNKSSLPNFDGKSAYNGAIRFYDVADSSWERDWGDFFGALKPVFRLIAIDAFGTAYGLLDGGEVAIFWPETGELEPIGADTEEFYGMIIDDPIATINYDLYLAAVDKYRMPSLREHFAFKIETALGGKLTVENLEIKDAIEHFKTLAKLANKIKELPEGTRITRVLLEE